MFKTRNIFRVIYVVRKWSFFKTFVSSINIIYFRGSVTFSGTFLVLLIKSIIYRKFYLRHISVCIYGIFFQNIRKLFRIEKNDLSKVMNGNFSDLWMDRL